MDIEIENLKNINIQENIKKQLSDILKLDHINQ
jgi:hypothetical protein